MPALFTNRTTDGSSAWFKVPGAWTIYVYGTFDSATLTLEVATTSGGNAIAAHTLTAEGVVNDTIIGPHWIRATVSSAGAGTTISVSHAPIPALPA